MKIFLYKKKCISVIVGIIRRTILRSKLRLAILKKNEAAKQMFQIATKIKNKAYRRKLFLLGPTPNAIMRVNNRYFYQVIIKYKQEPMLQPLLKEIFNRYTTSNGSWFKKLSIDAEPMNFYLKKYSFERSTYALSSCDSPERTLKKMKAQPVTIITDEIVQLLEDMYETMLAHDGIGLAALQIGKKICKWQ